MTLWSFLCRWTRRRPSEREISLEESLSFLRWEKSWRHLSTPWNKPGKICSFGGKFKRHIFYFTYFGRLECGIGGVGGDEEGSDDGDASGHHPAGLLRVLEHPIHVDCVEGGDWNTESAEGKLKLMMIHVDGILLLSYCIPNIGESACK